MCQTRNLAVGKLLSDTVWCNVAFSTYKKRRQMAIAIVRLEYLGSLDSGVTSRNFISSTTRPRFEHTLLLFRNSRLMLLVLFVQALSI